MATSAVKRTEEFPRTCPTASLPLELDLQDGLPYASKTFLKVI